MSYASAAYCALTPGLSSQNPSVNFIYLTAPAVIPRVRVLWKIRKKIKVGISPRRADALVVVTSIRRSPCRTVIATGTVWVRSEEHTSELQSRGHVVCCLLLEKKNSITSKLPST